MICERCKRETTHLKMSFFNTDICCITCIKEEREHPNYAEAKNIEIEECKKGNMNFEGIGLPSDFSRFLENRSRKVPDIDDDFIDEGRKEIWQDKVDGGVYLPR